MVVSIAVWSLELKPKAEGEEPILFTPPADVRITGMALGDKLEDAHGRTSVKLCYQGPGPEEDPEDEENKGEDEDDEDDGALMTTVLGSLTPGKVEQSVLDICLEQDEDYIFELVGKNTIYLSGNYIDQSPVDNPPFGDSDSEDDAYALDEVSSDVEVNPEDYDMDDDEDEDSHRFEEIKENADALGKKRRRDSDVTANAAEKLSKAEKKKLNKKLKTENGDVVPTGTTAAAPKSGKKEKKEEEKKEKEKEKKADTTASKTIELAGGVKARDVKIGTGPQAKAGQTVSMRYVGKLDNKTIFDKNTSGAPFTFKLGKGEVIKGWDVGIAGMAVGGERELVIPPAMAYGNKKSGPIPAGSTLTFECKLLKIK